MAFAELAVEEGQFIDAYLRGLLGHPLHAVVEFRGGHGQGETGLPGSVLWHLFEDAVEALVRGGSSYLGTVEGALAVHEVELIPHPKPQDTHHVLGLFLWQLAAEFGVVEVSQFLGHIRLLFFRFLEQ